MTIRHGKPVCLLYKLSIVVLTPYCAFTVVMGMCVAAETITKAQTTKIANLMATYWHRLRTSLALPGWFCEPNAFASALS
jgi:hypothetical protein